MKLKSICKKIASVGLASALFVSGITYQPGTAKAAAKLPEVTVLGATLSLDADAGHQSMRVAIQVTNADNASACGMDITYGTKTIKFSTKNNGQNKLYDYDLENNTVVYAVKIKNIPVRNFADDFTISGFATPIDGNNGEDVTTGEPVTKSVNDVVEAIKTATGNEDLVITSKGYIGKKIATLDITKVAELTTNPAPGDFGVNSIFADGNGLKSYYDGEANCAVFENYENGTLASGGNGISYYVPDVDHDYVFSFELYSTNDIKITGEGNENAKIPSLNSSWSNVEAKFTPRAYLGSEKACPQVVSYCWTGGNTFKIKSFDVYQTISAADVGDTKLPIKKYSVDLQTYFVPKDYSEYDNTAQDGSVTVSYSGKQYTGTKLTLPKDIDFSSMRKVTVTYQSTGSIQFVFNNKDGTESPVYPGATAVDKVVEYTVPEGTSLSHIFIQSQSADPVTHIIKSVVLSVE